MSITQTTLSAAAVAGTTVLNVASATGITAPNFQTGAGITYLVINQEKFLVTGVAGTFIAVLPAQGGTRAAAHVSGETVLIGAPADFAQYSEILNNELTNLDVVAAFKRPAVNLTGSADAIPPGTPSLYVVTTAGVDAMTIAQPALADEGNIIEIWSGTDNAHTLTAASTYFCVGASAKKSVATFPAYQGAGVAFRVRNQLYDLLWTSGTGTNSGPIVWT